MNLLSIQRRHLTKKSQEIGFWQGMSLLLEQNTSSISYRNFLFTVKEKEITTWMLYSILVKVKVKVKFAINHTFGEKEV